MATCHGKAYPKSDFQWAKDHISVPTCHTSGEYIVVALWQWET